MFKHLIAIIEQYIPYQATPEIEMSVKYAYSKQLEFLKQVIDKENVEVLYMDSYKWSELLRPMHKQFNQDLGVTLPQLEDKNIKYYLGEKNIKVVHILGGNVSSCLTNQELPFNYYNFIKGKTHLVLDLCYDYTPKIQDNMLTMCMWCNANKIDYTSSERAIARIKGNTYHPMLNHYPY